MKTKKEDTITYKINKKLQTLVLSKPSFVGESLMDPQYKNIKYIWKPSISIRIDSSSFTFDALTEIAELFQTTSIDIHSEYSEGCPTCGGSTSQDITIYNPVI